MCINNKCQGTCRRPCSRRIREQRNQSFTALTFSTSQEPKSEETPLIEVQVTADNSTLKLPISEPSDEQKLCA